MPSTTTNQNTHLFHVLGAMAVDDTTLTLNVPGGNLTLHFESRDKMRHVAAIIIAATPSEYEEPTVVESEPESEPDEDSGAEESEPEEDSGAQDAGSTASGSEAGEAESSFESIGDVGLTQELNF